jgi:hypothetical protein
MINLVEATRLIKNCVSSKMNNLGNSVIITQHPDDAPQFYCRVVEEVLFIIFQAAASTESPLPGPDVQDAWPQ